MFDQGLAEETIDTLATKRIVIPTGLMVLPDSFWCEVRSTIVSYIQHKYQSGKSSERWVHILKISLK